MKYYSRTPQRSGTVNTPASSTGPRSRSPLKKTADASSPSSAPLDLRKALSANISSLSVSQSNATNFAGNATNKEHHKMKGQDWHSESNSNGLHMTAQNTGDNYKSSIPRSYSSASSLPLGGDNLPPNGDLHPLIATAPASGGASSVRQFSTISNGATQPQKDRRWKKRRPIPFFMIFLVSCVGGATFLIVSSIYLTTHDELGTKTSKQKHQHTHNLSHMMANFAELGTRVTGSAKVPSSATSKSAPPEDSSAAGSLSSKRQAAQLEKIKALKEEAKEAKRKEEKAVKTAKEGDGSAVDAPQWPSIPPPLPGSTREKAGDGGKKLSEIDDTSFFIPGANQTKHGLSGTVIPQYLWFTDKTDILKTKKPLHFYENVVKTIEMYTHAFAQTPASASAERNGTDYVEETPDGNDIRVTCMDNDYCDKIIAHVAPGLVKHFHKEKRGDYKADMCRLAALYLHGGYYFDVDIDVIEPVVHAEIVSVLKDGSSNGQQMNHEHHDITFSTAVDLKGLAFFQAFMAATPRHPVVKMALKVIQLYYQHSYRAIKGPHTPMGPMTLAAAYKLVVGEPIGSELGSGPGGVMKPKIKRKISPDEADNAEFLIPMTGKDRPAQEMENYRRFMASVAAQKVTLTTDERWAIYNSTLFLKEASLERKMYPNLPRKRGNIFCNMIVHDPIGQTPYFYSRIAGSQNCQPTICGGGHVGNGKCEDPEECCSPSGWCGRTPAHCNKKNAQQNKILQSLRADFNTGEGWCGEGKLGNGTCPFADLCCSASGWCGTSSQHCRGYCGNGRIGNGKCRATSSTGTPPCCSPSGWCGTTPAHCSGSVSKLFDKAIAPVDKNAPCGNGNRGNGKCAESNLCCSPSGWCGTSAAHCKTSGLSSVSALSGGNKQDESTIYCGNGKLGNGKCEEPGLCCSPSGWCGKTPAHCKRTECGNGIVGNGQCADPSLCCSPSGWCGKTPAHCSSQH